MELVPAVRGALSLGLELFGSLIAPPLCAACDARVALMTAFCPACAAAVHAPPPGPHGHVAAFAYGGSVARAIARLKYERRPDLARPLGDLLLRAVVAHAHGPASAGAQAQTDRIVVPVPLHPNRLAQRGFNQSALLARHVARGLGAPFVPLALARTRETSQQAGLDRAARLANLADAFVVRRPASVRGRCVVLVDDVRTTGATLEACTRALRAKDATAVISAVVAAA